MISYKTCMMSFAAGLCWFHEMILSGTIWWTNLSSKQIRWRYFSKSNRNRLGSCYITHCVTYSGTSRISRGLLYKNIILNSMIDITDLLKHAFFVIIPIGRLIWNSWSRNDKNGVQYNRDTNMYGYHGTSIYHVNDIWQILGYIFVWYKYLDTWCYLTSQYSVVSSDGKITTCARFVCQWCCCKTSHT